MKFVRLHKSCKAFARLSQKFFKVPGETSAEGISSRKHLAKFTEDRAVWLMEIAHHRGPDRRRLCWSQSANSTAPTSIGWNCGPPKAAATLSSNVPTPVVLRMSLRFLSTLARASTNTRRRLRREQRCNLFLKFRRSAALQTGWTRRAPRVDARSPTCATPIPVWTIRGRLICVRETIRSKTPKR